MKKHTLLIALLYLFVISCNEVGIERPSELNREVDTETPEKEKLPNYFPIQKNYLWEYTVAVDGKNKDKKPISKFTETKEVDGKTAHKFENPETLFGWNNEGTYIRKEGSTYYLSGFLKIDKYDIEFKNKKFLDDNISEEEINNFTESKTLDKYPFSQFGISGNIIPTLEASIEIKFIGKDKLTVNSVLYNDVLKIQYIIFVKVLIDIEIGGIKLLTHTFVEKSPLATLTQNFANHTGCVKSVLNVDGSHLKVNDKVTVFGKEIDASSLIGDIEKRIKNFKQIHTYSLNKLTTE